MLAHLVVAAALLAGPTDRLEDPALEAVAQKLETEIIAYCCWRAPVSDHYSEVANQVRVDVRRRLAEGMNHDQILQAYVDLHGKRILSAPLASGIDLASWILPIVALAAGALAVVWFVRSHSRPAADGPDDMPPIDDAYAERLAKEIRET